MTTQPNVGDGSDSDLRAPKREVRFAPDIVAKVENRTTQKISRKLIFGLPPLKSVIYFGLNDMVPHVAARKTHQRL